jgi:glutamate---cysteine ligase / carboxylate-amine ligase
VSVNLLRLAAWRAARSGLDGPLLDPRTYIPRTANAVVQQLIAHVSPALRDSGDLELVDQGWRELTQRGTGAARQRQVAQQDGDLAEVVRQAVARTTSGELRRWLMH